MKTPIGFLFAGLHAGLKPVRRDVALVASDVPAVAAACFTTNAVKAAPILDAAPRVPSAAIRAVVINSGNANALTGEAGLKDFTWYCLRHTFASRLVMAGVDLRTVAELMGHRTIQMTMRYAHLAPAHTLAAVEKLVTTTWTDTKTGTQTFQATRVEGGERDQVIN